jgi:predicted dehydrogenase
MSRIGIGVIGCGNISGIYLQNCRKFKNLEVVACADLIPNKAEDKAREHGVARACSVDELLADPSVGIVLNLTIPKAHAAVNIAALNAGKHVYAEKPLGITRDEGREVLALAKAKGLRVGGAPDTFLGAGLQTCRKLIDEGAIGKPVSATAFMLSHGVESWHPNPEFYYQPGGGPMLDMGPYYLTALVSMLGPIKRLCGMTNKALTQRVIRTEERFGERIPVETATHVAGLLEFEHGAIGTIVTSFDVWGSNMPLIEIHGTEGSLSVPDPNSFGGPVRLFSSSSGVWEDITLSHPFGENWRGLGVADMALAISEARQARASGELCYHVLDVMQAFGESSDAERFVEIEGGIERLAAMPLESSWLA